MRVLEKTKGEEVKKLLGANTDAAFRGGAFGLPWFVGESAPVLISYECKGRDGELLGC
jgi:2-hydroxychromene-2-carboxylate isomerase